MTVPTDDTEDGPYLSYRMLGPSLAFDQPVWGPMWQYDDVNDSAGWQDLGRSDIRGGAWESEARRLTALMGKTTRLRLRIAPGDTDWLIDDVSVNSCTHTYRPPWNVSSVWSGTSAVASWVYNSAVGDHFELSYSPPIPGAPTFLPGLGRDQFDVARSVTITDLDPTVVYTMTIALFGPGGGGPPGTVTIELRAQPSEVCPVHPPLPFLVATPRKPTIGGSTCTPPAVIPRRN
jgi:hypothetical protein